MKRYELKLMKCCLIGLLIATHSCGYFKKEKSELAIPYEEAAFLENKEVEPDVIDLQYLEQNIENLFNVHGTLLNNAIIASLNNDSPDEIEAIKADLFENAHEIADLFTPIYGSRVAKRFEYLFDQHIKLGSESINAIQAHDQVLANQISTQALANADLLVEFFNIINPFFAYEPERRMFEEHVTLEAQQAMAYFDGDFVRAEQLKKQSMDQLQEIATHILRAIEKQMDDQVSIFCECDLICEEDESEDQLDAY